MRTDQVFNHLRIIAQDVAPVAQARIASAIVYRKEIIGLGVCRKHSHPLQKRFARNPESIYIHAEVDAIRNVLRKYSPKVLRSSTLIVVRQKFLDNTKSCFVDGLAKPCEGCQEAILYYKIPQVEWTTDNA